jgi:hypothetical protein
MSDAAYSLMFLNGIAGFATRLSVDGVAIYAMRYDYPAFGSWELVAGRRRSRVKVVWDGKTAQLRTFAAHLEGAADVPRWQLMSEKDFAKRRGEQTEIFSAAYATIRQHSDV